MRERETQSETVSDRKSERERARETDIHRYTARQGATGRGIPRMSEAGSYLSKRERARERKGSWRYPEAGGAHSPPRLGQRSPGPAPLDPSTNNQAGHEPLNPGTSLCLQARREIDRVREGGREG